MAYLTRWNWVCIVCLLIGIAGANVLQAQEQSDTQTLIVIGSSEVYGGKFSVAREKAIADSLITAVAIISEEVLQENAFVDRFAQINELLLDHTDRYVQEYKVLTEAQTEKTYRVVVQVTVARMKLAGELSKSGILSAETTLPSVLFLVSEKNIPEYDPRFWWQPGMQGFVGLSESAMRETFREKGFSVVAPDEAPPGTVFEWAAEPAADLSDEQAIDLAKHYNADLVIVGTSVADAAPNIMGSEMRSFKGVINARALRTETGEALAKISRTAVSVNSDEFEGGKQALEQAGYLAGELLAEQLEDVWRRLAQQPSKLKIVVEGTGNLANFVKFRRAMGAIAGVEGIQIEEMKPNETTLIVEYKGKAEELASALMLKSFETFGINIYEVMQNNLRIALIPS
jgi:hypothetical protein